MVRGWFLLLHPGKTEIGLNFATDNEVKTYEG